MLLVKTLFVTMLAVKEENGRAQKSRCWTEVSCKPCL